MTTSKTHPTANRHPHLLLALAILAAGAALAGPRPAPISAGDAGTVSSVADSTPATPIRPDTQLRALMLSIDGVTNRTLAHYQTHHVNAIVLDLDEVDHPGFDLALTRIWLAGLEVYYWLEIGHDREAARAHPEWLHRPHKTAFYGESVVIDGWICINNAAAFDHALARVTRLAQRAGIEGVRGIFLNDVLGAPEGCGCGNALCRLWDGSVGPKISGDGGVASFGDHPIAPRLLAERLSQRLAGIEVIPIITEECEGGVTVAGVEDPEVSLGYGRMSCRNPCAVTAYARLIDALSPLARVGMLALYRTFARNVEEYGSEAAWIGGIIERYHAHDPSQEIIAVLEGWDVTPDQVEAQIAQAFAGGAAGFVLVRPPLDQTWQVRPLRARGKRI